MHCSQTSKPNSPRNRFTLVSTHLTPPILALQATRGAQLVAVLRTVLTEIRGILNSKPLGYVSSSITDPDPITPNSLLNGRPDASLPHVLYPESEILSWNQNIRNGPQRLQISKLVPQQWSWTHSYPAHCGELGLFQHSWVACCIHKVLVCVNNVEMGERDLLSISVLIMWNLCFVFCRLLMLTA